MKEIIKLKDSVIIQRDFNVPFQRNRVFNYFIENNLSKVYSKISVGHKYFTLRDGNKLQVGSIIDCEEEAGNQTIRHKFLISEISENDRIYYYSNPSEVKIKTPYKIIESTSNTHVYYDFNEKDDGTTDVRLTIMIQFNNKFEYFFSKLFGGVAPWEKHASEEMLGLKECIVSGIK